MDETVIVSRQHPVDKQDLARRMRREMTPAERCLWQRLRRNQLGGLHFRRQQVIDGFVADFYCHAACLVVEADGAVHDNQAEYDRERSQIFAARGVRVLRLTNTHILKHTQAALAEILVAAGPRTYPPGFADTLLPRRGEEQW